jgi:hypothetical protein
MIFFQIAPEHVLDAVGGIEDAGAQALLRFVERVEEHALAIFVIAVRLRQKGIVIEHMLVERPRVFCEAERRIRPEKFGEINGIRHRVRDRQVGMPGIDVHRRDVDFNFRRKFFEIEAADAVRRETHASLEFGGNPLGVFSDFQCELLRTHHEARRF